MVLESTIPLVLQSPVQGWPTIAWAAVCRVPKCGDLIYCFVEDLREYYDPNNYRVQDPDRNRWHVDE